MTLSLCLQVFVSKKRITPRAGHVPHRQREGLVVNFFLIFVKISSCGRFVNVLLFPTESQSWQICICISL